MHILIYLSAASHLFSDEELIDILNKASIKNKSLDVTGLLLYNEGSVIQILEGEKETVHMLFNSIKRDRRHRSIIKMMDAAIAERSFSDWSMGFKRVSDKDWSALNGYVDFTEKDELSHINHSPNASMITLIKSFTSVNNLVI